MSVSAVGNQIYINQNMHINANEIGNIQNRFDLQSAANITALQEKEKGIEETRATEETKELNPDRDSHKNQQQQEKEKSKEELEEEEIKRKIQYFIDFRKSLILDIKA
ncbi:MAG: hypothetical protein HXX81_05045 [Campylobacterales bacterium]|nr:hypothetical protein [Campylobacterales bacterium]